MAKEFEILEHTADVGVAAFGKDLKEAFTNAARGLFAIITDLATIEEREQRKVVVSSDDRESLLVAWLNELIYLFDTENLVLCRFDIASLGEDRLEAVCYGERVDRNRHPIKMGVKAATFHQVRVERGDQCRVQVYLDI